MDDFGTAVTTFGWPGAILIFATSFLCSLLVAFLWYIKAKIDEWVTPLVKSQIELVQSVKIAVEGMKESVEGLSIAAQSQSRSLESQAKSFDRTTEMLATIEKSTGAQTTSNKLMAVGLAQMVDNERGITKEQHDDLAYKFLKLEEHVMMQDTALNLKPKEKAESITEPKLRMEPMQRHEMEQMESDIQDLKDDMKSDKET